MKKFLLTLAAGAALTAGLVAGAAPASAEPVGFERCEEDIVDDGVYVGSESNPILSTCSTLP